MDAFSEGWQRSNFDFNIIKLSGNNSIVSDIIKRLRGTCSGMTPEMCVTPPIAVDNQFYFYDNI